jgi:S1-C subfamily serine protease
MGRVATPPDPKRPIRNQSESLSRTGSKGQRKAIPPRRPEIVYRLTSVALALAISILSMGGEAVATLPSPEPFITLLDLHPVDNAFASSVKPMTTAMPHIVRQGVAISSDQTQIQVPAVVSPAQQNGEDPGNDIGRAGTGFFVGVDGTLLTAAHVVKGCNRMQIISKYVARAWVSLVALDDANDIAVLKAVDLQPPAIARIATSAPASGKLFMLGYPASAGLTVPTETWGTVENQKFPASIGALASPRELLWMLAPAVTHGYSGGPIFDPKLGAVVGIVKGEVDGGYLRLVPDMPTTGVAIGPGIDHVGAIVRKDVRYAAISPVSAPGEAGEDTLRRATVHVLCWH